MCSTLLHRRSSSRRSWPIISALCAAILLVPMQSSAQGKAPAKPVGFEGLSCQTDIAAALVGRKMPNGKVVDIESRHKALQLQNLGAVGVQGDPYVLVGWLICGHEYLLLESKTSVVKGVLKSPSPFAEGRLEIGECQAAGGKKLESVVFHRPVSKANGPWTVASAWSVREPQIEFAALEAKGFVCRN